MEREQKIRVMVIDSDIGYLSLIRLILQAGGQTESRLVQNGSDVLATYEGFQPQLIVMDTAMPGMSGSHTLREILQRDADIPILIFSALPEAHIGDEIPYRPSMHYINKSSAIPHMRKAILTQLEQLNRP
ncbi:response regulator [Magnetococcus sp. PR-3]|uniref:response regulator n=1 Tax=Magnetococcus sp. PR-3 TaxID=3120355 RepID=UPI002FCE4218